MARLTTTKDLSDFFEELCELLGCHPDASLETILETASGKLQENDILTDEVARLEEELAAAMGATETEDI